MSLSCEFYGVEDRGGIYRIRNRETGRTYIGETQLFRERAATHRQQLARRAHHNIGMQADYDAGAALVFEVIAMVSCAQERRAAEETVLFGLWPDGLYNSIIRAPVGPKRSPKWTPERKAKHIEMMRAFKQTPDAIARSAASRTGQKRTEEARKNMRAAALRRWSDPQRKAAAVPALLANLEKSRGHNKGKPWSASRRAAEEARKKAAS